MWQDGLIFVVMHYLAIYSGDHQVPDYIQLKENLDATWHHFQEQHCECVRVDHR